MKIQTFTSVDKWKELALRFQLHQTIDNKMQDLMDKEKNKWREILHSVVEVIKFYVSKIFLYVAIVKTLTQEIKGIFLKL